MAQRSRLLFVTSFILLNACTEPGTTRGQVHYDQLSGAEVSIFQREADGSFTRLYTEIPATEGELGYFSTHQEDLNSDGIYLVQVADGWNLVGINSELESGVSSVARGTADLVEAISSVANSNNPSANSPPVIRNVRSTNVLFGYYQSVVKEVCGKKKLVGWQYVGFAPFGGSHCADSSTADRSPCHQTGPLEPRLYGLTTEGGTMVFLPMDEIQARMFREVPAEGGSPSRKIPPPSFPKLGAEKEEAPMDRLPSGLGREAENTTSGADRIRRITDRLWKRIPLPSFASKPPAKRPRGEAVMHENATSEMEKPLPVMQRWDVWGSHRESLNPAISFENLLKLQREASLFR